MESAVNSFGIVPNKIFGQFAVECFGIKKIIFMVVDELILQGPVESFQVGVHFRHLGVGMIVNKVKIFQLFGEVLFEFRTIVG